MSKPSMPAMLFWCSNVAFWIAAVGGWICFFTGECRGPLCSWQPRNVTGLLVLMNSITMVMQLEFEGRLTGAQLGFGVLAHQFIVRIRLAQFSLKKFLCKILQDRISMPSAVLTWEMSL